MTDAERAAAELAETLRRINQELADNGRVSQQTQQQRTDAEMKAKHGIENFTAGTAKAAEGVFALGKAGMSAGKAMLDGKKGAAALNTSLDDLSTAATAAGAALALMIPGGFLIKGFIAAVTLATTSLIKYTQAANEMADQLHKGYQGLAKAGGAAADGMTGLKNDAQKLGLAMTELDQLVSLVAENSKDFALFAGSVSQGRKAFADIGQAMTPARTGLMNLGMSMKDINEGTAEYLRTQARTGRAQTMSTAQLAKGAEAYLKEMDGLTKLTGQSRAEMQQQRDRMLQQEQSAAKLRAMEMAGNKEGADALKVLGNMLGAAGPKMQAAFNASITGNLASKEAQEANLASQGELARVVELVQNKQITAAEGAQRVAKAMGNTADTVGTQLGQLNAYESSGYGNFAEQQNLRLLAENNFTKTLAQINKDQQAQIAGADPLVAKQTELIQAQMAANKAMTDFISKGIGPAQDAMIKLARTTEAGAKTLDQLTPGGSKLTQKTVENVSETAGALGAGLYGGLKGAAMGAMFGPIGAAVGAVIGSAAGVWLGGSAGKKIGEIGSEAAGLPKGADGGMFSGPTSGYLAMLHGNELVIPEDQLMGKVSAGGLAGTGGEQLDAMSNLYKEMIQSNTEANQELGKINQSYKGMVQANTQANEQLNTMNNLYKEMFKDTQELDKLTEADLKKTQNFSRLSDRVRTLKTSLMVDEIDLLEEQNDLLEKMVSAAEAAAPGTGKDIRRSFNMMRLNMGAGGSMFNMGGGPGLQMPSGMNSGPGLQMPSGMPPSTGDMGGAQGLQVKNQDDLKNMGLKIKKGDVQAEGAKISPKLIELAKAVQANVPGFSVFTGFNDQFHQDKAPGSHTKGLAMDFTVSRPPSVQDGKAVTDWLKQMGASLAIDEYNNPSAKATGGHYHAQIPAFADGGLVDEATLSLIGEAGPEAVIPLKDGNVPVSFNGKMGMGDEAMGLFKIMAEQTATMAAMMEQMVAAQKNTVDVQTKMLRMQS